MALAVTLPKVKHHKLVTGRVLGAEALEETMTFKTTLSTAAGVLAAIAIPITGGVGGAYAVNTVPADTIAQSVPAGDLGGHLKSFGAAAAQEDALRVLDELN